MKKISMLSLLAIALALPSLMFAQSSTTQQPGQPDPSTAQQSPPANPGMAQPPDQNGQATQPEASEPGQMQSNQAGTGADGMNSQSAQTLTGTISVDGKTLTSNGTTYNISNPNSVKAYANQPVSVEYEMDTNNSIRVTKLILQRPQQ